MKQIKKSVIDLLNFLSYDEESKFLPQSKNFDYQKIGKANVEKKHNELEKVNFDIVYDSNGYSFEHISFTRDKANVSLRVKYDGIATLPNNEFGLQSIKTFIYRAYSLITDGKLNTPILPILPSPKLIEFLTENNILFMYDEGTEIPDSIIIDLSQLPIIDDVDFPTFTSSKLVEFEMELFHLQALRKYLKSLFSEPSGNAFQPTPEVENWLKNLGITSFNGYKPKTEKIESDGSKSYQIKTLKTKISSLSNLPSVNDVKKKIESNKALTAAEAIMFDEMKWFDEYISEELKYIKNEQVYKSVKKEIVYQQEKEIDLKIKSKLFQISQIVFYILITGKWFEDKEDITDNNLDFNNNGRKHTVLFELSTEIIEL